MTVKHAERSGGIFEIGRESGLDQLSQDAEVPDSVYNEFAYRYRDLCRTRDPAITNHLRTNASDFRGYLPMTPDAFIVANQVFWYYDELVTADPLYRFVSVDPSPARDDEKKSLLKNYQVLRSMRPQIEDGLVLLATPGGPRDVEEPVPVEVAAAAADPEVIAAFDSEAIFGQDSCHVGPISLLRTEVSLESAHMVVVHFENVPPGTHELPIMEIGKHLPRIDRSRLPAGKVSEMLDALRKSHPHEAMLTLVRLRHAARMNAGLLLTRSSSVAVANKIASRPTPDPSVSMSLAVPYLEGVPAEALAELRERMPDAFVEFRRRLHDVVTKTALEGEGTESALAAAVERDVMPQIRGLTSEMDAVARQSRVMGYGVSTLIAGGSLGALLLDTSPAVVIAGAVTGLVPVVKAAADFALKSRQLTANPYYYLWKARAT